MNPSLTSLAAKVTGRLRDHRRAYLHAKADRIAFSSGLGSSCDLLYGLVRSMKPDLCVEIGSARGRSACSIGMALKENGRGKLVAIDPHRRTEWNDYQSVDTFETITGNLAVLELTDWVEIRRSTSLEAVQGWQRPIDMIFIDGDHSYAGVKRDWQLFMPHVRQFGVVVFHDTLWDLRADLGAANEDMGVPKFVEELRSEGYPVLTIDKDYGVSLVQPVRGGLPLLRTPAPR
jgi:predicted O-methyltransferase YrrM